MEFERKIVQVLSTNQRGYDVDHIFRELDPKERGVASGKGALGRFDRKLKWHATSGSKL